LRSGQIPSIVPTSGWGVNEYSCGGGPAWGIAFVTIPYALYRFRGELVTMRALYPSMRRYAQKLITELNPLCRHGFGDWVAVKLNKRGDLFSCRTTPTYTSTAYAYRTLVEMAAMAEKLGKRVDADTFAARAETLRGDFNKEYYKGNGVYENGFACGQALALHFGLAPEKERPAVQRRLIEAVHAEDDKIDFGLLGSTVVFRELSEAGETDLAWKMIMNESYPGFANWIVNGATTLWENWKGTSSRNHIMFGDFAAWAYAYIAGVRPIEPGFKRFEVRPRPPSALNHVKATVPTPHGLISVEWRKTEGKFTLRVSVPKGTTAEVTLPSGEKHVLPDGNHILEK
jgi:alpha-L-rhamnosidase